MPQDTREKVTETRKNKTSQDSPGAEELLDLAVDEKLLTGIEKFIANHSGADFGGVNPPREKTQYKHTGSSIKKHGGNPPVDFHYVEEFVDLQLYVQQGDFENALPLYFKLRRLIH